MSGDGRRRLVQVLGLTSMELLAVDVGVILAVMGGDSWRG